MNIPVTEPVSARRWAGQEIPRSAAKTGSRECSACNSSVRIYFQAALAEDLRQAELFEQWPGLEQNPACHFFFDDPEDERQGLLRRMDYMALAARVAEFRTDARSDDPLAPPLPGERGRGEERSRRRRRRAREAKPPRRSGCRRRPPGERVEDAFSWCRVI